MAKPVGMSFTAETWHRRNERDSSVGLQERCRDNDQPQLIMDFKKTQQRWTVMETLKMKCEKDQMCPPHLIPPSFFILHTRERLEFLLSGKKGCWNSVLLLSTTLATCPIKSDHNNVSLKQKVTSQRRWSCWRFHSFLNFCNHFGSLQLVWLVKIRPDQSGSFGVWWWGTGEL